MKTIFAFILSMLLFATIDAQSLRLETNSLQPQYTFYGWENEDRIYLTNLGSLERQFPKLVLSKIYYDSVTRTSLVEGFTNNSGLKNDSFGLCCFDVIVAQTEKSNNLVNIRHYGKTLMASDSSNISGLDGFFRFEIKLSRKDVLLIGNPGTSYWGAVLIPIGKFIPK